MNLHTPIPHPGTGQPGVVRTAAPGPTHSRAYTALIRTFDSAPLVFRVISALRTQSVPPAAILAVDSGSEERQAAQLRNAVDRFVDISDCEFNYSRAINIGVGLCETPYVMIVSSHLLLDDDEVMRHFLEELEEASMQVGFMISRPGREWETREVDAGSFNGANGLTNSCSFLPVALARQIPFREEVFAAEDQEWTARYIGSMDGRMLGVATRRIQYLNPRFSYAKKLNEELALAYFVDRRRLAAGRIALWLLKAAWSVLKRDMRKARFRSAVAVGLVSARRVAPIRPSKYF